ncbi:MAG: tRNA (adenosine(37)-N6)-dimethylallyltransferase MiaA [Clostridia bacterium]|nr:tRNA (adenosine(37)-N6)-dimethylallyltransferase MiaA [Clostridia bacterium]
MKLLCIGGATASGKTSLSVGVAKALGGEIISADSMQIYKGMDVGTSKIKDVEMENVPHHLLSFVEPNVDYSVSAFVDCAIKTIEKISSNGNQPIICGGTGFYFSSLLYEKSFGNVSSNEELRQYYAKMAKNKGNDCLFEELIKLDPKTAEKLHKNDVKRVIRALELAKLGIKKSDLNDNKQRYPYKMYCIDVHRDKLYKNINLRVDQMVDEGLIKEAEYLYNTLPKTATAFAAIGYKEIFGHFDGQYDLNTAIELIKKNTRHYAKRQITYFKHQFNCVLVDENLSKQDKINFVLEDFSKN